MYLCLFVSLNCCLPCGTLMSHALLGSSSRWTSIVMVTCCYGVSAGGVNAVDGGNSKTTPSPDNFLRHET